MPSDRDPKYKENGETEGLTLRQIVVEIRADVKALTKADSDHMKEGHSQHPTWPQVLGVLGTLVAVFAAFTTWAG